MVKLEIEFHLFNYCNDDDDDDDDDNNSIQ